MDEHDPISQRIEELDRLADQVLGPIDHVRRDCLWVDRRKTEDYIEILARTAAIAAQQYITKKEGVPPHVRSAARSKLDRGWLKLMRLLEGLIGATLAIMALPRRCSAAFIGPRQAVTAIGLAVAVGTIALSGLQIASVRKERQTDRLRVAGVKSFKIAQKVHTDDYHDIQGSEAALIASEDVLLLASRSSDSWTKQPGIVNRSMPPIETDSLPFPQETASGRTLDRQWEAINSRRTMDAVTAMAMPEPRPVCMLAPAITALLIALRRRRPAGEFRD